MFVAVHLKLRGLLMCLLSTLHTVCQVLFVTIRLNVLRRRNLRTIPTSHFLQLRRFRCHMDSMLRDRRSQPNKRRGLVR